MFVHLNSELMINKTCSAYFFANSLRYYYEVNIFKIASFRKKLLDTCDFFSCQLCLKVTKYSYGTIASIYCISDSPDKYKYYMKYSVGILKIIQAFCIHYILPTIILYYNIPGSIFIYVNKRKHHH